MSPVESIEDACNVIEAPPGVLPKRKNLYPMISTKFDLGDLLPNYSPKLRKGCGRVALTSFGAHFL